MSTTAGTDTMHSTSQLDSILTDPDVEIDRYGPPEAVELRWAGDRPDSVVDDGVMDRLFEDSA